MKIYQYKDFFSKDLKSVKDVDVKEGIVTGYFAAFGNIDLGGDLIEPGAFKKTIQERGGKSIYHLYQHDTTNVLGKPHVLKEDNYGLYFESKVSKTALGSDILKLYEDNVLDSHSIGYKTILEQKDTTMNCNRLKELMLFEGSTVTFPMNPAAVYTGMKSLSEDTMVGKIKKLEAFCKNSTATDETIELLLLTIKQLQQLLIDKTTLPEKTTEPEEKSEAETLIREVNAMRIINEINLFKNSLKTN